MLEDMVPPDRVTQCMIRTVLENLSADDGKILREALADREAWGHKTLAKALIQRGLPLGEHMIRRRRSEPCAGCVCRVD